MGITSMHRYSTKHRDPNPSLHPYPNPNPNPNLDPNRDPNPNSNPGSTPHPSPNPDPIPNSNPTRKYQVFTDTTVEMTLTSNICVDVNNGGGRK
jgi:hypothetical protein